MNTRLDRATETITDCANASDWLQEELVAALGDEHPLLAMTEHISAELWRANVLLALYAKETS